MGEGEAFIRVCVCVGGGGPITGICYFRGQIYGPISAHVRD